MALLSTLLHCGMLCRPLPSSSSFNQDGGRLRGTWAQLLPVSLGYLSPPHSSPHATQSLFFNLKHMLCEVSSLEDPHMIPHYPHGEGKYLGLFCHFSPSNFCFPSQTFPCSPPGLLTASWMLVHLFTFPFPTPNSGRPIYFILIYF